MATVAELNAATDALLELLASVAGLRTALESWRWRADELAPILNGDLAPDGWEWAADQVASLPERCLAVRTAMLAVESEYRFVSADVCAHTEAMDLLCRSDVYLSPTVDDSAAPGFPTWKKLAAMLVLHAIHGGGLITFLDEWSRVEFLRLRERIENERAKAVHATRSTPNGGGDSDDDSESEDDSRPMENRVELLKGILLQHHFGGVDGQLSHHIVEAYAMSQKEIRASVSKANGGTLPEGWSPAGLTRIFREAFPIPKGSQQKPYAVYKTLAATNPVRLRTLLVSESTMLYTDGNTAVSFHESD